MDHGGERNDGYLRQIAGIYAQRGDALSRYTFVFPNRRAGLFFRKYLGQALHHPIFSPQVMTVDECFHTLCPLQLADSLTLLVRLYAVYRQVNPKAEPFGKFLRWGQMMLADFSEIDNHLVPNVRELFSNIKDLKELDDKYNYLSEAQLQAIRRFWGGVFRDMESGQKEVHERFLRVWEYLYPCYEGLRALLRQEGLAYEGMIHREVIEHLTTHTSSLPENTHFVFIGFNALTGSEEALMLHLQKEGIAEFCFDYGHPFLRDPENRASLFFEHNKSLFFPKSSFSSLPSSFPAPEITLLTIPSDVGEAGQAYRLLDELSRTEAAQDWTRTAVVLPDEGMLLPLLTALPPAIPTINITMGYPLRATRAFIPVMQDPMPDETPHDAVQRLRRIWEEEDEMENSEAAQCLLQVLNRIEDVLLGDAAYAPPMQTADLFYVLRMLTEQMTIPYVGEPLSGLQVMGVLETRALDFDNLIIMGFNDELYPGKSRGNSYIPYTLRKGFGMPVPERQDAIFAYNFYRMIGHARHVWFISNSQADDKHTGEVSRYWQQLLYQYHLPLQQMTVVLGQAVAESSADDQAPSVAPTPLPDAVSFSPSSLNTFLRCERKYYYQAVAGLSEQETVSDDEVDDRTLGTAFHALVQQLYIEQPADITTETIRQIREDMRKRWDTLQCIDDVRKDPIALEVVRCYADRLLDLDEHQAPFRRIGLEQTVRHSWQQDGHTINLKGTIDRIDQREDVIRLIDYKTGHADLTYKDLEQAFTTDKYPYVLQTMIYCWLYKQTTKLPSDASLAPYIFPLRAVSDPARFTGKVHPADDKQEQFVFDEATSRTVETLLRELIHRVLAVRQSASYAMTDETRKCESCSFAPLCRR